MPAERLLRLAVLFTGMALAPHIALGQRIAVITSPSATGVTRSQLARIYLGRSFERKPLDLPDGHPLRAAFYKEATDADPAQVRAAWSRIMFTGRGEPPRELPNAGAVKKAVLADANAIGYIDAEAADASVRTVFVFP